MVNPYCRLPVPAKNMREPKAGERLVAICITLQNFSFISPIHPLFVSSAVFKTYCILSSLNMLYYYLLKIF